MFFSGMDKFVSNTISEYKNSNYFCKENQCLSYFISIYDTGCIIIIYIIILYINYSSKISFR